MWYNEVSAYNYNNPVFGMTTGHFTQVVWNASNQLGMGLATSSKGTYCVGQYQPAGNYAGQFSTNVKPIV
jgi:hypothetical protein